MGGRTDGGSGWDLYATAPTALQSHMHASGSCAATTRKYSISKGKKKENTAYSKIKVPGGVKGQEQDKLQPKAGDV